MKKFVAAWLFAVFTLAGCSSQTQSPTQTVEASGSQSEEGETQAGVQPTESEKPEEIEAEEEAVAGFFNKARYSEEELASFREAYDSLVIEYDDFDNAYSHFSQFELSDMKEYVRRLVQEEESIAFLTLQFNYGEDIEPSINLSATYMSDRWLFLEALIVRANGQNLELDLPYDLVSDVLDSADIYEVSMTEDLDERSLEFLSMLDSWGDGKARLLGDGLLDWELEPHEVELISRVIDAYRHVIMVKMPELTGEIG
jgi:hypothetical protein